MVAVMHDSRNLGDTLAGGSGQIALIDLAADSRRFSFDELDGAAAAVAAELDVQHGQRVGLLAANSAALVATLFGVMRAGAVAVPINTKLTNETLAFIARDAELVTAYVDQENTGRLPVQLPQRALQLSSVPRATRADLTPASRYEAGLVLYTSGSTGTPKGVELSHASQWSMVDRIKARLERGDRDHRRAAVSHEWAAVSDVGARRTRHCRTDATFQRARISAGDSRLARQRHHRRPNDAVAAAKRNGSARSPRPVVGRGDSDRLGAVVGDVDRAGFGAIPQRANQ